MSGDKGVPPARVGLSKAPNQQEGHVYGEETWMVLRALYRQGWTKAALDREFGLNRRTIIR